jgi:hypothetical protein
MSLALIAGAVLQIGAVVPPPPDTVEAVRRTARRAEAEFERLSRTLVPRTIGGSPGTDCDEIVGRFCLKYGTGFFPRPDAEHVRVVDARRRAIGALRRAFAFDAGRLETAGPLVRYLVEDDRPEEAASAARLFAALSRDSVWGPSLVAFALHAAEQDTVAERLYAGVLDRLPDAERRRVEDVSWIIALEDRRAYRRMDPASRAAFERRLWRFADPLYLTPGNERWVQHVSRHVWSRILAMTPIVTGVVRWGRDLEELTVRYGVPTARSRTWGSFGSEGSLVEHYDPDALGFVPEDLMRRGLPPTPLPGETWALDRPRARSAFAPRTIRRLVPLDHQVTRFPVPGGTVLRIDAKLVLDSVAAGRAVARTALFVLDEHLSEFDRSAGEAPAVRDTVWFAHEVRVAPGEVVYSMEALEAETRLAGRARYATDIDPPGGLRVSDPLIARPFGRGDRPAGRGDVVLRPLPSLRLAPSDTIGLYAEFDGLDPSPGARPYRVELSVRRADRAVLPARVVSWLGGRIGLGRASPPPRLAWSADAAVDPVIAVDLQLDDLPAGLHVVHLRVTDARTGRSAESSRLIRID